METALVMIAILKGRGGGWEGWRIGNGSKSGRGIFLFVGILPDFNSCQLERSVWSVVIRTLLDYDAKTPW